MILAAIDSEGLIAVVLGLLGLGGVIITQWMSFLLQLRKLHRAVNGFTTAESDGKSLGQMVLAIYEAVQELKNDNVKQSAQIEEIKQCQRRQGERIDSLEEAIDQLLEK